MLVVLSESGIIPEKNKIYCRLTKEHLLFRNSHPEFSDTEYLRFCQDFTIRHSEQGIKDQIEHHNREISRLHNELDRISETDKCISQIKGGVNTESFSKDEAYLIQMINSFNMKKMQVPDKSFILWAEPRVKEIKKHFPWFEGIDNDLFRTLLLDGSIWKYFYKQ